MAVSNGATLLATPAEQWPQLQTYTVPLSQNRFLSWRLEKSALKDTSFWFTLSSSSVYSLGNVGTSVSNGMSTRFRILTFCHFNSSSSIGLCCFIWASGFPSWNWVFGPWNLIEFDDRSLKSCSPSISLRRVTNSLAVEKQHFPSKTAPRLAAALLDGKARSPRTWRSLSLAVMKVTRTHTCAACLAFLLSELALPGEIRLLQKKKRKEETKPNGVSFHLGEQQLNCFSHLVTKCSDMFTNEMFHAIWILWGEKRKTKAHPSP